MNTEMERIDGRLNEMGRTMTVLSSYTGYPDHLVLYSLFDDRKTVRRQDQCRIKIEIEVKIKMDRPNMMGE